MLKNKTKYIGCHIWQKCLKQTFKQCSIQAENPMQKKRKQQKNKTKQKKTNKKKKKKNNNKQTNKHTNTKCLLNYHFQT